MGLFGATSPCESEVEKATSEKNTTEEWGLIMEVCDKAGKSPQESKDYLRAIIKRLNNADPHVSIQAVTLLDACVKNSGKTFHIELASREFENDYIKLLNKSHPQVTQKLKESLKKWAEGEFKTDQQLNLIPSLYTKLKNRGTDFNIEEHPKRAMVLSKDPNVVQSQEEEDQIAKAIMLSLKETSSSPRKATTSIIQNTSLYPSTNVAVPAAASAAAAAPPAVVATPAKETRKVRALYDFEAAEDNELTFSSGEIIFVHDDSDPNWWKGSNQRGEGLFPANFVTADLSLDPDQLIHEKKKKLVQLDESLDKRNAEDLREPENVEINEGKIDRLLHLLHEADPTNPEQDTHEMIGLEREVNSMGPLIDNELERVDRKHAQLTQLSSDLVEALSLYHTLMREPQFPVPVSKMPYGYQPQQSQPPHSMAFNGTMPHQGGPQSMANPMMGYNVPIDRNYMASQGPQSMPAHGVNMPPPFAPTQGLPPPPGHMPSGPGGPGGHPPGSLPPMSAPPHHNMPPRGNLPPNMQQDDRAPNYQSQHGLEPRSISQYPHYMPISVGQPSNGTSYTNSMPPQASNTHM